MDGYQHSKLIRNNFFILVKRLTAISKICDILESRNQITSEERHTIDSKPTRKERNRCLLFTLSRRSKQTYEIFLEALSDTNQQNLRNLLTGVDSGGSNQSPSDHTRQFQKVTPDIVKKIAQVQTYPMNSHPRGLAVIVNIEVFTETPRKLSRREGSSHDVTKVDEMLKELGFHVTLLDNLAAEEIGTQLQNIQEKILPTHNAFILFLMSHGEGDQIYGYDCNMISTTKIISIFNNRHCKPLQGKPKLFFIQACRGDIEVSGVAADGPEEADSEPMGDLISGVQDISLNNELQLISHELADIFISRSTPYGYKSWRHPNEGSWFIQILVKKMYQLAHEEEINSIMTAVNSELHEQFASGRRSGRLCKQIAENVSYLTKQMYFCPESFSDTRTSEVCHDQTSVKERMDTDETLSKEFI